jgi:tripartite-type tricarboxylate transporter receptor subunit TctC
MLQERVRSVSAPARKLLLAAIMLVAAGTHSGFPQSFPSRPITMIVPFPPGGPSDVLARIMSEGMRVSLGQPVIIENVSGAAGSIGVGRVARAEADGYTAILGNLGTHVFNGATYNLSYNVLADFEPVALLPANYQVIVGSNAIPAKDLQELVAWVRANSDKVTAGTAGPGSPSDLSARYFQKTIGAQFQLVPYRGTPQAMQDLVAGRIDLLFDQVSSALPLVRSGSIKAFAITAGTKLATAPDIPSVDEAGLPGFYTQQWFGLWVPKGTMRSIVNKLSSAVMETLADPAVRSRLSDLGSVIPPRDQQNPEALAALQKAEIDKWWPIIKAAGVKAE